MEYCINTALKLETGIGRVLELDLGQAKFLAESIMNNISVAQRLEDQNTRGMIRLAFKKEKFYISPWSREA
jgi:hypothetical protein